MTAGKTIALNIRTVVGKVMSLLFNTLFRFVIAFLPRSNRFLILRLQSPCAVILKPKKRKSVPASTFSPSVCHEVKGTGCHDLSFFKYWVLSWLFHCHLSLSSRFFCSSLLSAVRVVSSTYLRLLIFSWQSWSQFVIHSAQLMCSAKKLNKQGDIKQLVILLSQSWLTGSL